MKTFAERIKEAEDYIEKLIDTHHTSEAFLNGVDFILKGKGVGTLKELSNHLCYSERQLQRIFSNNVGITPKYLMNLIRYQYVWQEMLCAKHIDYFSLVHKYNFTDQGHLITEFKKYHSMTPKAAVRQARDENVCNIVDGRMRGIYDSR